MLGAQRAARALCDAAPRSGVEGGMDFWLAQAEILLSGLLFVAHHAHRDMGAVCEWVLHPGPAGASSDRARSARARPTCMRLEQRRGRDRRGRGVARASLSVWEMEERTRSSIYATAQTVVWPWSDPGVAASALAPAETASDQAESTSTWLLAGANTVYLCSPIEDQRRLAPAFGGLLNDLINQAYRHVAATGRPLDPPLLVVIDEAGNTPLRALPEYASTLAGIGVLLVTIWQSLAQIEAAYGRQADTILTNHLTKLLLRRAVGPGVAALRRPGPRRGRGRAPGRGSASGGNGGLGPVLDDPQSPLAPAHALRQMRPGDALLVHGTLPPAHVRTRPFYRDRGLVRPARAHPAATARSVAMKPSSDPPTAPARAGRLGVRARRPVGRQRGRGRLRPPPPPDPPGPERAADARAGRSPEPATGEWRSTARRRCGSGTVWPPSGPAWSKSTGWGAPNVVSRSVALVAEPGVRTARTRHVRLMGPIAPVIGPLALRQRPAMSTRLLRALGRLTRTRPVTRTCPPTIQRGERTAFTTGGQRVRSTTRRQTMTRSVVIENTTTASAAGKA